MREKALAVDNSGRFLIEYFFEFNYYVDTSRAVVRCW